MKTRIRKTLLVVVVSALVLSSAGLRTQAQEAPPAPAAPEAPSAPAAPLVQNESASQVRREFDRILSQQPGTVRQVLRVDPGLMLNDEYLAPYPVLADYLAQHPEIPRNPRFFVGTANTRADGLMEALFAMTAMLVFAGGLIWITRTLIDYRRWSRLSRIQTEVHTKLLDRFTNSEDLQGYLASPAGRRFLEAAPIDMGSVNTRSAPAGRIMWSLQVGLVLTLGGAGLHVAVPNLIEPAAADPLRVIGTLAIALGIGFVVSAGASFILSQRLGLFTVSDSPGGEP